MGDYRLSVPASASNWAIAKYHVDDPTPGNNAVFLPEYDGRFAITGYQKEGDAIVAEVEAPVRSPTTTTTLNASFYGGRALFGERSACFAMAQSLETSNGMEISGLNAEEQSDISLTARWSKDQGDTTKVPTNMVFFVHYDAMLVLYENNVLQLIE